MTEQTQTQTTPDPRTELAHACAHAAELFELLTPAMYANPTPCVDWNVEQMAGHLLGVMQRVQAIADGTPWEDTPLVVEGIADDAWPGAWNDAVERVQTTFGDEARLGQILRLPWDDIPAAIALAIYSSEVLAHSWDLAQGMGVTLNWDQALAERGLAALRIAMPNEGRELEDMPFSPVVEIADDAPAIERFVAWLGRDPR